MGGVDSRTRAAQALLGLTEAASVAEVAAAYRRLARLTHPDRCADPGAGERFAELNAAYRRALGAAGHARRETSDTAASTSMPTVPLHRTQPVPFVAGPVHYTPSPDAGARLGRRG